MATDNAEEGEKTQLSSSSPQSVGELAPFHSQTREHNGGIQLSVHNHTPGPWNSRHQLLQASNASMSGHNPIIGELTAQSNRSSEQIAGRALPLTNASPDATNSRSTSSYSPNMANDGSPSFPISAGSHRRLRNQAPYQAPVLCPHQVWRAKQFSNPLPIQNVEGSSYPMLNMGSVSHQSLVTNRGNGVLDAAQFRATGQPASSSMVGFGQPVSHGSNNLPMTAVRSLSPRPVMAPARSLARRNWSGQPVPVNAVSTVNASQGSSSPKIVRVQRASRGILGQSPASVVNHLNNTHSHAHSSGWGFRPTNQCIRQANLPQPTTHFGPSLKRGASNSTPIPPAQRRKTRSTIPSRLSVATWRPIAPRQPPPSVDSIDSLFSRLLQDSLFSRLLQDSLRQSLLTSQSTKYIKWQEDDKACPSGFECPICKRDLSYKAEGPMYERDEQQSTSVLACGHYFHSSCLLHFTPADQAADPPCACCLLDR